MRLPADLRFAVRTLAKSPSFALIAIVSLALGIGANTAMFSYVDAVLLRPLPVPDSGRIVEVDSTSPGTRLGRLSYPDYVDLRDRTKTLQALACYDFFLGRNRRPAEPGSEVQPQRRRQREFLQRLGHPPVLGRGFRADEDTVAGRDLVAVISYHMWDREFARDRFGPGTKNSRERRRFHRHRRRTAGFHGAAGICQSRHLHTDACVPAGGSRRERGLSHLAEESERGLVGPPQAGRRAPPKRRRNCGPSRRGLAAQYPETNRGPDGHGAGLRTRALRKQSHRWRFGAHTAWNHRPGPADRLRQCSEPSARTRNGPREGNRDSHGDRRLARRTGAAASHRKPAAGAAGGLAGIRRRLPGREVPGGDSDPVRFPALPGHADGYASARVQPDGFAGDGRRFSVWCRHCAPRGRSRIEHQSRRQRSRADLDPAGAGDRAGTCWLPLNSHYRSSSW